MRASWPRVLAAAALFAATAAHAGGAVHQVRIAGARFVPERIEVAAGDTVIWTNEDLVPHTVTAAAAHLESGDIEPGKTWKFIARRKGEFGYICRLHPVMHGSLVVR